MKGDVAIMVTILLEKAFVSLGSSEAEPTNIKKDITWWVARVLLLCFITELANFLLNCQIANTFAFAGQTVSITITQLCCCGSKAAIDNSKQVNKLVCYRLLSCFLGKWYDTTVLISSGFNAIPCQRRNMPVFHWSWTEVSKLSSVKGYVLKIL